MSAIEDCEYAYAAPALSGIIRQQLSDFKVDEVFSFSPSGEGEHALLHIEKTDTNTDWLCRQIAQVAGVRKVDVSYAGIKDKRAITTQWFSVWLPGRPDPDWSELESENIRILETSRHSRKLRRGSLLGNRFNLIIRDVEGDDSDLAVRISKIMQQGVPNYFTEQRFGINGQNLEKASRMFNGRREKDRFKRSMYLSAARAAMFNSVLSQRVAMGKWADAISGDVMLLDNSHSYFILDEVDDKIQQRLAEHDIHPSGPLWGKGELLSRAEVAQMEASLAEKFPLFDRGLKNARLQQDRRSLRLSVKDLQWQMDKANRVLKLSFFLPAGGYATAVLRELVRYQVDSG